MITSILRSTIAGMPILNAIQHINKINYDTCTTVTLSLLLA